MVTNQESRRMTFYNHIESVRSIAIDLTDGRKWRGASDKAAVFDALDAARREYIRLSDENAKLRERITTQKQTIQSYQDALRKWREVAEYVHTKNTKLLEMVRSVLVLRHETAYKWLDATMAEIYGKSFTEQARELGIEVD